MQIFCVSNLPPLNKWTHICYINLTRVMHIIEFHFLFELYTNQCTVDLHLLYELSLTYDDVNNMNFIQVDT